MSTPATLKPASSGPAPHVVDTMAAQATEAAKADRLFTARGVAVSAPLQCGAQLDEAYQLVHGQRAGMRSVRGTATAVVLSVLVALALVANAGLMALDVRRVEEADGWVSHTHEVLETLQGILTSLRDAESAERGFIITGNDHYLEPFAEDRSEVSRLVARLSELTLDNPAQRERIAGMRPFIDEELGLLERGIALRRSSGFDAAKAVVLSGEANRLTAALRTRAAAMDAEEQTLLNDRGRSSAAATRTAKVTNVLGVVASLVLLAIGFGVWRGRTRDRERAAAVLTEEKEKFRTTLTSIGDGVVVTDHLGRITMLNSTAASLLGWGDDAIGKPLDEVFRIVNEHTRQVVESPVPKVLREGKVAGLANHTVLLRRDNSEIPIDDSGAPIRRQDGNIAGVVLVFRDIRDRREAERELQRRTDLLEEQDRRKDQFLATLSHELRNPLAPILNAVAVLKRAPPASEEVRRARTVIDRQAAFLARLVDDLLDVTRIARGKIRLRKELVDLTEIVRRTVDDHCSLFASKGISLALKDGDTLWLNADPTRLAQVTENLLHNAAKFTNRGGHVTVELERQNGRALLRIRDEGVGIERAVLATIFKPYVQGEKTLEKTRGGLGLGLALSKGIVELHGGSIEAFSGGPGKGAEFVVALPFLRDVAPPPERAPTPRPHGHLRICIVDDNEDAAHTLQDLLELGGHKVHVAIDGQLGLDLSLAVQPDVVLCDVGLPLLDGFEVARRLRAAGSTAMLVALTGYASPEDAQQAKDAGFDHHLAKPIDIDRLQAVLSEAVVGGAG